MYPAVEPYASGLLDVGDGNSLYWESCGVPDGVPALVLHGGPGSGCTPFMRRFFDPDRYRVVLVDQRNCGRSIPHASDPTTPLATNTTAHLLADLELLRRELSVERWLVFGHSWGSVLGLAYAVRFPDHVSHAVLSGVATGRWCEIDYLYRGLAASWPSEWDAFLAELDQVHRGGDVLAAYRDLLESPVEATRLGAARAFNAWEWATMSPGTTPPTSWLEPSFQLARARIVTHYFSHHCWLEDGELLRGARALGHIPALIVNGEHDPIAPLHAAELLTDAWPNSALHFVAHAGHSNATDAMSRALVGALDRIATSALGDVRTSDSDSGV